ncbi:U-box domain-containing protein 51-like, partial [Trifolium medium]|nr:U-box domain-containing protein 51-like [Trifolium medium]
AGEFDVVPKHGRAPTEEELHQLFLPFRGFCARKGIIAKELVLHDIDVSSALTDYIIDHSFINVVVGAPRWNNAFIRRFKDEDVPTSLIKSLPETCTVHIISKGKVHKHHYHGGAIAMMVDPSVKTKMQEYQDVSPKESFVHQGEH